MKISLHFRKTRIFFKNWQHLLIEHSENKQNVVIRPLYELLGFLSNSSRLPKTIFFEKKSVFCVFCNKTWLISIRWIFNSSQFMYFLHVVRSSINSRAKKYQILSFRTKKHIFCLFLKYFWTLKNFSKRKHEV